MTVRAFDGSSYVTCSLGACGFDAGPSTLLGLVKRSNANAGTVIAASSPDAATKAWALLFGDDATLSGNPRLAVANSILDIASQPSSTTDGWMLQAVTKAAGSASPRFHRCRFSDSTIVHNNAFDPIFDGPAPTSGDTIRFGLWQTGGTGLTGRLAMCAAWEGATSFAYQWQRFTGSGYASIGGATGSTLTLTEARVGDLVRCQVTATNTAGSTAVVSNEVGPVIATSTVLVRAGATWAPGTVQVRQGGAWTIP
jgi:hypothetical protein